ncbi:hypothetical protein [Sulfuricurvum sp.]|uniref:hypothetical protein n=1 Tax=Sulfuricurvum sp. TaxID=2025608 RepID=UPI003BB74367
MATNTNKNHRTGSVKNRTQTYNPTNHTYVKRGPDGKFMDVKSDGTKFKGVAIEPDGRRSMCPHFQRASDKEIENSDNLN